MATDRGFEEYRTSGADSGPNRLPIKRQDDETAPWLLAAVPLALVLIGLGKTADLFGRVSKPIKERRALREAIKREYSLYGPDRDKDF